MIRSSHARAWPRTADILEKFTWGLVTIIAVLAIIATFSSRTSGSEVDLTNTIENTTTTQEPEFPAIPVPQEAPSTEAPATETPAN